MRPAGSPLTIAVSILSAAASAVAEPAAASPGANPRFTVTQGTCLAGEALPLAPSTANCESRCMTATGCVAYQLSRNGVCEAFASVTSTRPCSGWRSGLRSGQAGAPQR